MKDSCENCDEMLQKLNEKNKTVQDNEQLINELINIMNKFKSQLNFQDDILKLASNKLYADTMLKIISSQPKNNNLGNGSMVRTKK